jgi:hypothetical protein
LTRPVPVLHGLTFFLIRADLGRSVCRVEPPGPPVPNSTESEVGLGKTVESSAVPFGRLVLLVSVDVMRQ